MFETLPGFRDFLPELAPGETIFSESFAPLHEHTISKYDAPILEPLDLFIEKSGPEIASQLFHFADKGDRQVAFAQN